MLSWGGQTLEGAAGFPSPVGGGATAYAVAQFTERGGSGAGGEGRASVSDRLAGNWHRVPSPHPHMATVKARGKAVHRQGEGNVLRSW